MKKRTRNFLINIAFCIFVFIICILYGHFFTKLPELTSDSAGKYKFLSGLKLFCFLLPSVFASGISVCWCIDFGLHPDGSFTRFSDAMFARFKEVLISSLIFVLFITCVNEIAMPQITNQIETLEFNPVLMKEYQNSAKFFYENKNYETAYEYAHLAYKLDPKNTENQKILYITESYNDKKDEISAAIKQKINEMTFGAEASKIAERKTTIISEPYKSFELMQTAKTCLEQKDWFGAHYYAQLAIKSAEAKDINIQESKQIAATAWNKLNDTRSQGTTEEQKIFAKKYEGYIALVNGDILHSYYVFHALSLESKKLSIDSDVVRYLEISKNLLKNQYFFRDETRNLQAYESANNVYFKINNNEDENSGTTLYFIHGITTSGSTSNMIMYLRGLEIIELDESGSVRSGYYVPYAKMSALQTNFLDEETKNLLNIDKRTTSVPYIILNSVDKNFPNQMISAEFKIGYNQKDLSGILILGMPFSDFSFIAEASGGADSMNLISLLKFAGKAEQYGYSSEVFAHILMNRILKPLYILILFIIIAYISWHFRLEENSVFKFKWIVMFPLLAAAYIFLYNLAICFFKFINYGLLGMTGPQFCLPAGIILYAIILIIVSLFFLSCRNSSGK